MQKNVFPIHKAVGATPLAAVEEFRKEHPEYQDQAVSYAGRLDPMAEGLLLLLVGEENKKRKEYEGMVKEYLTEIVLGISTDTYDALGMVQGVGEPPSLKLRRASEEQGVNIDACLKMSLGKQAQEYPPYSSKPVNGKPLFWWARNNKLDEIEIPKKEIEIYSIDQVSKGTIGIESLCEVIDLKVKKVKGNFRQEEILERWEAFGEENKGEQVMVLKLKVACSSGTYIRGLASDIGKQLGCGAMALSITRTKVGEYSLK